MPSKTCDIVIVDDDEHMLKLFGQFLRLKTRAIVSTFSTARDLSSALDCGLIPDIALVDYCLADGVDGIYVCRKILVYSPGCVVIMMSGMTRDALTRDPAAFGVRDFLQKPFTFESLGRKVREVLDRPSNPCCVGLTRG